MIELAALERREGERSEPSRSGGAANSRRAAVPPAPDPEVVAKAQRRKFTADYKLGIVEEADRATDPGAIGALLRREGLYSSHLVEWRRLREAGALGALSRKRGRKPTRDPLAEENGKLKAELARVNKKLQQAEIIIDVQKKVSALLGIALPEAGRKEGNS
jgi:transposase-like protein